MSSPLAGRRIVLGVTGGVAAYKAVDVCRELVRRGAFVSPVLTHSAERFIGAATLSAVASEPARTSLWESPEPSPHTDLGQQADLVLVVPATAHVLAAARTGSSDDLLTTTLLATRAPVLMAPAMHTEMWEHPATRDNVEVLRARGVQFAGPDTGELAGGDSGVGRLTSTDEIVRAAERLLVPSGVRGFDLDGVRVLVSAGGTREAIDPVRFIGNRSSGKQGFALAEAAAARGAVVQIVATTEVPAALAARVQVTRVETAEQLRDAMRLHQHDADVVIMSAAVADYRPISCADRKLKRRDGIPEVVLEPTPDVLAQLVEHRHPGQVIVGFAAETDHVLDNAEQKLRDKQVDLLVVNDVTAPGAGFECDTNVVTILGGVHDSQRSVPLASKLDIAHEVLDDVVQVWARSAANPTVPGVS